MRVKFDLNRQLKLAMLCGAVLLICLSSGCASQSAHRTLEPVIELVWPEPPLPPRVRWLGEIRTCQDAGLRPGFWKKVGRVLFGESEERILRPYGVLGDARGRLLVADPGAAVLHVMDRPAGRYTILPGTESLPFRAPIGLAKDDAERVYITDSAAEAIFLYDLQQHSLTLFNTDSLKRPTGIAFNRSNGLLYVSDTAAHQIIAFDLQGRETLRFGGRGAEDGQLNYPTDLWADAWGRIIVTDSLNGRLQVFSREGRHLQTIGRRGDTIGNFDKPKGIATDSDGNLYVCDALKDTVQVFAPNGTPLFNFGEQGQGAAQFWMPSGIYIDENDTIYVSDTYNQRVQKFQYLGIKK